MAFFLLMILAPPTSTLFPYTTLFRSTEYLDRQRGTRIAAALEQEQLAHVGAAADMRDRKSTRLNSSHSQNSYAVFCLKKNKRHGQERSLQLARSLRFSAALSYQGDLG